MMNSTQSTSNGAAHDADFAETTVSCKIDDRLKQEMNRLAAINQELLGNARVGVQHDHIDSRLQEELERLGAITQGLLKGNADGTGVPETAREADDLPSLRRENTELRARLNGLEHALEGAPAEVWQAEEEPVAKPTEESPWAAKQKEYEAILEEKSEIIRGLHLRLHELQGSAGSLSDVAAHNQTHSLKKQLEEEIAQVKRDEDELMTRMQQMEKAMSKDRAELTRQRNEIQRLHQELNQEIETASVDPGLRERLGTLEVLQGKVSDHKPSASPSLHSNRPAVAPAEPTPGKQGSGLLRRIFRK
jgi:hypothetical protein